MNKKQAIEEGYEFIGAFSFNKDEMKLRVKKEKIKGYLAVVIHNPPNKYSRRYSGIGYSIYRKDTPKTLERKEQEKKEKEQKLKNDIEKINTYFLSLSKESIITMFIQEKGDQLLSWARKKNII